MARSAHPERYAPSSRKQTSLLFSSDDSDSLDHLLIPDSVLPEQFYPQSNNTTVRGEVALMWAVLEDALICFQRQFQKHGSHWQQRGQEAEAWFFSEDTRWPFSYLNICAGLGIDPAALRLSLPRWHQCQSPSPALTKSFKAASASSAVRYFRDDLWGRRDHQVA